MSITLAGYNQIVKIYEGDNTVVYRACRDSSPYDVIVKTLKSEYPTIEELGRLRHEYKILQSLDIEGIVKPLALETLNNGLALIFSDFGGTSLKEFIGEGKLSLSQFLEIATSLASTLAALHKNNIIHKDIKPDNIVINPKTGEVKIIDFSIASRRERENQTASNPDLLEGTLAYMSPEQTGRMNRSIDYRTDFYSLGVTFYEMLTGQLPFQASDSLELVHCHIAKTPVPPSQLNLEVPQAVSDIVMKLVAKTAEERYQNALGLKADLEVCQRMLEEKPGFLKLIVGQLDSSSQFIIPQKLYGRDRQSCTLMDAFERVTKGANEMMLVSGYSGMGKSSLVNEVQKPIVGARGYFISGKFDQFKRNIPYASVIQAFHGLMRQLLTESTDALAVWKSKLLEAFMGQGKVIIDVIPEVEKIVGTQPSLPELGAAESQNRFNRVFQQFIHVFTKPSHPLVLFLDDLQWADSASLSLIKLLVTDPNSQYLLLIGAYRDNEVSATHPLMLTMEEIQKTGAVVNNIILAPLQLADVNQLVSDTLHCDTHTTKPLAELVFKKTQGNPFFLTQLLKSLYQEKLLSFNFTEKRWQWDIEMLQSVNITDNVVELMVSFVQQLSPATIDVLKLAACIGARFNLDVLSTVNEKSQSETASYLWEALQAGLVLPLSNAAETRFFEETGFLGANITYKFLHDRVQQAAYSLIANSQKKQTHLTIGTLLLKHTPSAEIEENIFEIVNHLNVGVELINQRSQRYEIAKLNLIAGNKAKASTAYETAVRYLRTGLELLAVDSWETEYDLTLELYIALLEAEYYNTNYKESKALIDLAIEQARTVLDKAKILDKKIKFYTSQGDLLAAIDTGISALAMLGTPIPITSEEISQVSKQLRESLRFSPRQIADLAKLPIMTDAVKVAAMQILVCIIPPVYFGKPELLSPVIMTIVSVSVKYGNTAPSTYGYCLYGLLLCGTAAVGDIEAGYEFGRLSLKVLEQFESDPIKCQVFKVFASHIQLWKEPLRATEKSFLTAIQTGVETSNAEYLGYGCAEYCMYLFFIGENLETVEQRYNFYADLIDNLKQEIGSYYFNVGRQTALNLVGRANAPCLLTGERFSESTDLPVVIAANYKLILFCFYMFKSILSYLFKDYAGAVANASEAVTQIDGAVGTLYVAEHNFYYSLALLGQYPSLSTIERHSQAIEAGFPHPGNEALIQVASNQEKMLHWAVHAPCNFQHKYDLVEAEKARVLGQHLEAMEYYDRAIQGAREQEFIHEEALANELAAEFYFSQGRENIARYYLRDSYYSYMRWGATAKVQDLETRYPQILPRRQSYENTSIQTTHSKTGSSSVALDLATVMKASLALSGEIVLSKLLTKLMQIAIENAGAEKGFLILPKGEELLIEASGGVDREVLVQQQIPVNASQGGETPVDASQGGVSPPLPISIINYVARSLESVVLNDATREGVFTTDTYIINQKPKSVLCTPLIHQGKLAAILYLENNLTTSAFTPSRLEVLQLLSSQAAISIENARLYNDLEEYNQTLEAKVEERTQQLKEKEEAAQAANRAKSEFLANMSHELRTPLNGILGYAQILKKDRTLTEKQTGGLGIIHQCGEHLLTLINDILDLSKIEARKLELNPNEFHFPSFIQGIVEICNIRAEQKGISLRYEPLSPLPQGIRADEKRLRQVLINLLGNAVKFTDSGGVTFKVGYVETGKKGRSPLAPSGRSPLAPSGRSPLAPLKKGGKARGGSAGGSTLRFEVLDTGVGMAPEQLEEIFLPFQQVGEHKRQTEGTGLGLAISRQLVQMMGGEIKVESELGKGSVFWADLDLPAIEQWGNLEKAHKLRAIGFKGDKRKVMVVDDNSSNREILVSMLEPLGFKLVVAANGKECLDKLDEFKPDCILIDLVMPVMDGFEATRRIRREPKWDSRVVIATSASVFNCDRQASQDIGCNDFLPKPVREEELLEKLSVHLGLVWIYEEAETVQETPVQETRFLEETGFLTPGFLTPPPEEIALLLDLAMRGDLRKIVKRAAHLEELDRQLVPFATHLRQLAKGFKGKELIEFINQYKGIHDS